MLTFYFCLLLHFSWTFSLPEASLVSSSLAYPARAILQQVGISDTRINLSHMPLLSHYRKIQSTGCCSIRCIGKEPVLSAYCHRMNAVIAEIITQTAAAVFQISHQEDGRCSLTCLNHAKKPAMTDFWSLRRPL